MQVSANTLTLTLTLTQTQPQTLTLALTLTLTLTLNLNPNPNPDPDPNANLGCCFALLFALRPRRLNHPVRLHLRLALGALGLVALGLGGLGPGGCVEDCAAARLDGPSVQGLGLGSGSVLGFGFRVTVRTCLCARPHRFGQERFGEARQARQAPAHGGAEAAALSERPQVLLLGLG